MSDEHMSGLDEGTVTLTAASELLSLDVGDSTSASAAGSVAEVASHSDRRSVAGSSADVEPRVGDARTTPKTVEAQFRQLQDASSRRTDRLFTALLGGELALGVLLALFVSPSRWSAPGQATPIHVWLALGLGAVVSSVSIGFVMTRSGSAVTRHAVAIAQLVWSAILIHLTRGRLEAHFHIFASLAFLAFYRDWRVLLSATAVITSDHLLRHWLWPESLYGIADPAWWRVLEHAGWILFELSILVIACVVGVREMREAGRRRAEIESSHEVLARSQKLAAVGQLAASVGHELRNPLAAVRAAATFVGKRVKNGQASDPKVPQFLGVIEHELAVCSKIISDLLDFARDRRPELAPCPLRSLVDDAVALVPNGTGVQLVNDVSADLPVPNLDRDQFRQVITNLVQNAVEAIPAETKGRVVVTGARHGKGVRLSVSDNGAGISKETLDHIFEPLFTTKTKGTGLGLAIVNGVLARHAATISVESELGRGTTFHIDIGTTQRIKGA